MISVQRQRPGHPAWAVFLICFVFLAIRISGVHAHYGMYDHADPIAHSEFGLSHHSHDVIEHNHGGAHSSGVAHHDVVLVPMANDAEKRYAPDQPVLNSLPAVLFLAAAPAKISVDRYRALPSWTAANLRPPSCGPPLHFIT